MIRCRCGRWTNYGLTCSNCRQDGFSYSEESEKKTEKKTEEKAVEQDKDEEKEEED